MAIELKAGRRYRQRSGAEVGPMVTLDVSSPDYQDGYRFGCAGPGDTVFRTYMPDGKFNRHEAGPTDSDLVEELPDDGAAPATTGDLAALVTHYLVKNHEAYKNIDWNGEDEVNQIRRLLAAPHDGETINIDDDLRSAIFDGFTWDTAPEKGDHWNEADDDLRNDYKLSLDNRARLEAMLAVKDEQDGAKPAPTAEAPSGVVGSVIWGRCYFTRDGDVYGPMVPNLDATDRDKYPVYAADTADVWTSAGAFYEDGTEDSSDLVRLATRAEVLGHHHSETPKDPEAGRRFVLRDGSLTGTLKTFEATTGETRYCDVVGNRRRWSSSGEAYHEGKRDPERDIIWKAEVELEQNGGPPRYDASELDGTPAPAPEKVIAKVVITAAPPAPPVTAVAPGAGIVLPSEACAELLAEVLDGTKTPMSLGSVFIFDQSPDGYEYWRTIMDSAELPFTARMKLEGALSRFYFDKHADAYRKSWHKDASLIGKLLSALRDVRTVIDTSVHDYINHGLDWASMPDNQGKPRDPQKGSYWAQRHNELSQTGTLGAEARARLDAYYRAKTGEAPPAASWFRPPAAEPKVTTAAPASRWAERDLTRVEGVSVEALARMIQRDRADMHWDADKDRAFDWQTTPQGGDYWFRLAKKSFTADDRAFCEALLTFTLKRQAGDAGVDLKATSPGVTAFDLKALAGDAKL